VFEALAAAGFDDITTAQGRVFARIGPDGSRVTQLAEQAQVTKQTAGFLVDQLERAGYVRRVPDPADARARQVQIAPRGQAAWRWPKRRSRPSGRATSVRRPRASCGAR
jgi:DNA-binding MarR family transcriptional regulator